MKLTDAAKFFHTTPFNDGYTSGFRFKGKLLAFDDATRDSLTADRRMLEVAPTVTIPARRVVKSGSHVWIVGDLAVDYTNGGEELRNKYVLHKATELAQVRTFEEALLNTGTKNIWGARLWTKTDKETDESSGMYGRYSIFFSSYEDIRDPSYLTGASFDGRENNVLVKIDGKWNLARTSIITAGGFREVIADEMPDPVVTTATYTQYVTNVVTEVKTATPSTKPIIVLRWQSNFTYFSMYSDKYENGDVQAIVLKTGLTPTTGDSVAVQGRVYKIVSIFDQAPCWSLHLRRV